MIGIYTFFDFGPPFDFYEIMIVRPAENGVSIERMTLTPAEVPDKPSDPEILKQLETGKYDEPFQGASDKPSDLYRASQKRQPPPTVKLLNSLPIAPESFQRPRYPPLARVTHTEGAVSVKMDVDVDGAVTNIVFESGHPLLRAAVQDSISHWKFPKNAAPKQVEATIEFALNCLPSAEQKSPTN